MDFHEYVAAIRKAYAAGDATEHTHRPALKALLESAGKGIVATNEPRRIACGSPDFQITHKAVPLGHVETKDVGINLDEMERGRGASGEQFTRYRDGLPNWLLTDYLEFRWFIGGEKRLTVRVAELDAKRKIKELPEGEQRLGELLTAFYGQPALTIASAKELAQRMAGMTRIIRGLIVNAFDHEAEHGWLHDWLDAFRGTLIPNLDENQFADMFAQTLAYGLFAARVHAPPDKSFSREMAAYNLPKTNPFLRKLFAEIAGVNMPDSFAWAVDDIVELLKHADMAEILTDFGKGKEDPVVHFYETFLAAYDPKMRELRGVYYTPEPVVSYIVRSIDHLLKTRFKRSKGLADNNTLILDPATGTATFLYFVIDQIHQKFAKQAGAWDDYVAEHLLNRVFGFELLMAPYAVAHLKLGMQLQETGYRFESDQRLGIYLTNTLEEAAQQSEHIFARWVADEANAAAAIKRDKPILVVLGNPPYANFGQMNRGKLILSLLEDYKRNLKEKKLTLDDDFIKFIRFAQWRIERTGEGVLGFITNNTYLDGITRRRMRECLLKTFNEIYILNLHGSTKNKEVAPDGSKDESVFDITIGTAIALFVKLPNAEGCRVFHADMWGTREAKYQSLNEADPAASVWNEIKPMPEYFFFVPKVFTGEEEYKSGLSVGECFPQHNAGIQTKRDSLVYHFSETELQETLSDMESLDNEALTTKYDLPPDGRDWRIDWARADVLAHKGRIIQVAYHPFDKRYTYYTGKSKGFMAYPRSPLMASALQTNRLLLCIRNARRGNLDSFFIADCAVDKDAVSPYDNVTFFPLYLYPLPEDQLTIHTERQPNLSPAVLMALAEKLRLPQEKPHGLPQSVTPEDIFHYAYAIFHSPTYRARYAEFLKIDFPRLPLTSDLTLFRTLGVAGAELVALHLLESTKLDDLLTDWLVKGDNTVERVEYAENGGRVSINKAQYFGGVSKAVWEFHIGGYQVCQKWLKDRKGRKLTFDDAQHYQRIVVALNETIRLMGGIDQVIDQHGGWPIR